MEVVGRYEMGKRWSLRMNIYIVNLNQFSLFIIRPLNLLGVKVYFLNNSIQKNQSLSKIRNLSPIKFNKKNVKSKRLLRLIDFGENDILQKQITKLLPEKILKKISNNFHGIEELEIKLKAAFISKFNFNNIGRLYLYDLLNYENNNLIIIIHTNFHSYVCKENGVNIEKKTVHLYLPTDDFIYILNFTKKLINRFKNLSIAYFTNKIRKRNSTEKNFDYLKSNTGIIIHNSMTYGKNLFFKNHYFSSKR